MYKFIYLSCWKTGAFVYPNYLGLVNMNAAKVTNRVGVQGNCSFTFQWQRDNRKKLLYNLQSCWRMFCHCQQIFQRSHTLQDITIWFSVASLTTRENGFAEKWWSTFVTVSGISYFQSATTIEYRLKVQKVATGNKQQTHCNSSLTSANMEKKIVPLDIFQ